jgi:hypothetical protein
MDRQKVIEGLKHCKVTECDGCSYARDGNNTEACFVRVRNDALVLLLAQPDLTPYLAAAAIYVTATPNDGKVNVEAIIESARALRDADMAEEK